MKKKQGNTQGSPVFILYSLPIDYQLIHDEYSKKKTKTSNNMIGLLNTFIII